MYSKLPPGPWDSKGNKVTVNGQTVAVVFYPRDASEIAKAIAELPDLLRKLDEQDAELTRQSRHMGWEEEEIDG